MPSVNCAVHGCHNNWTKRNQTLSFDCFDHGKKRSECCGPKFTLHRPPTKVEELRPWLKALNLKKPPKFPFVCSYHFVDGKPTPEHPYPEKWLGYNAPLKRPRRVLEKYRPTPASDIRVVKVEDDETFPPPEHNYGMNASPSIDQPLNSNQETQCSGPPELHQQLLRTDRLSLLYTAASASCAGKDKETSRPPEHNYGMNASLYQPLNCNQATQCSGPPELHRQLLRTDRLSLLYTGLPLEAFSSLANQLTKDYNNSFQLDAHDQVLMTLMKLRLNLLQEDLAERFHVSQSQVSKITLVWYDIMEEKMSSDIPPGDVVMANRGLVISDLLHERKTKLISSALTKEGMPLSEEDTTNTRRVANVRVHDERAIRRLKIFRILSQTFPVSLAHKFDKILRICAALSHLRGDIIHEEED